MSLNPAYIEDLVRAHWREVHSVLTAITRNPATAEDLAQEVFITACRKNLEPGPKIRWWLRNTARFLALNELRRRRPAPTDPEILQSLADRSAESEDGDPDPDFERRLAALRLCLSQLPEADRDLLAARYSRREPLSAVGQVVGQSVGYIKQRLSRLRRRLQVCIERRLTDGSWLMDEEEGT